MKCSICKTKEISTEPKESCIYEYLNLLCLDCFIKLCDDTDGLEEDYAEFRRLNFEEPI